MEAGAGLLLRLGVAGSAVVGVAAVDVVVVVVAGAVVAAAAAAAHAARLLRQGPGGGSGVGGSCREAGAHAQPLHHCKGEPRRSGGVG